MNLVRNGWRLSGKEYAGAMVKVPSRGLTFSFSGLETFRMGMSTYFGMTHNDNRGMIKIFEDNNCEHQNVIVFNTKESN